MGRVISYGEKTGYNDGDYLLLDNGNGGTKRIRADRVGLKLDPSIGKPGFAADSAIVKNLLDQKLAKPVNFPDGISGQILRTNGDGTTQWVDGGLPTDEQTSDAVTSWLNAHPEATTTVTDESLTSKKLVKGTLGFVTPEMYGAIGDGVNDDTLSIQAAFDSGASKVLFSKKQYRTRTLSLSHGDVEIDFNNCSIICDNSTFFSCINLFDGSPIYTGSFDKNTIESIVELKTYNGLVFVDSEECVMPGRNYYLGGTIIHCKYGMENVSLPYGLNDCSIYTQSTNVCNITLKNLSQLTLNVSSVATTDNSAFIFNGVYDVVLSNINFVTENYIAILLNKCSNVIITDSKIATITQLSQAYTIDIFNGSTFCSVQNCELFNNSWHCITTGGEHTVIHTRVTNCHLIAETSNTSYAYTDHGNTVDTVIDNCVTKQSILISDGKILNCTVLYGIDTRVILGMQPWLGSYYHSNFEITGCKTPDERLRLNITFDTQNPYGNSIPIEVNSINISNCIAGSYIEFSFMNSSVNSAISSFHINEVYLTNLHQIDVVAGLYATLLYITNCDLHTFFSNIANYTALFDSQCHVYIDGCNVASNMGTNATVCELYMTNSKMTRTGAKIFYVTDYCMIDNCVLNSNFSLTDLVTSCYYHFRGKAVNICELYKAANSATYHTRKTPVDSWVSS